MNEVKNPELTKLKEQNCVLLEQVASLRGEVEKLKIENTAISDHISKLHKELSVIEWEAIRCNPTITNEIAFVASLREKMNTSGSCSKEKCGIIRRTGRLFKLAVIAAVGTVGVTSVDFLQEKVVDACAKVEMKYGNKGAIGSITHATCGAVTGGGSRIKKDSFQDKHMDIFMSKVDFLQEKVVDACAKVEMKYGNKGVIGSLAHTTCGAVTTGGSRIKKGSYQDKHMEILMSNFSSGEKDDSESDIVEDDDISSKIQQYGDMANDMETADPDMLEEEGSHIGDNTAFYADENRHESGGIDDESMANDEDYSGMKEEEDKIGDIHSNLQQDDDMQNNVDSTGLEENYSSEAPRREEYPSGNKFDDDEISYDRDEDVEDEVYSPEDEDEEEYVYSNFQQNDEMPNGMDSPDFEESDSSEVFEEDTYAMEDEVIRDNISEDEFYFPEENMEEEDEIDDAYSK